jgi:hypothetical protein
MASPARAEPPEAAGPGTQDPSGLVVYGERAAAGARVFVPPPRPAEERERDRAERERNAQCSHCAGIPKDVLQAMAAALRDAEQKGRRGR